MTTQSLTSSQALRVFPISASALNILLWLLHISMMWPGVLSIDSMSRYNQALAGIYGNHHPILMSLLWHYLLKFYAGPGLMLVFHLSLMWASVGIIARVLYADHRPGWWLPLTLPFWPHLYCFSGLIWKDVGLGCSYLFACALLIRATYLRKINLVSFFMILGALCYGTGVKYQAQFVLPWITLWLAYIFHQQKLKLPTWITGISLAASILIGLHFFDRAMVPLERQSQGWQMVKIYDLAGTSLLAQKELFPSYLIEHSNYSWNKLVNVFSDSSADPLFVSINGVPSPFFMTSNPEAMQDLRSTWKNVVLTYPHYYLFRRLCLLGNLIRKTPLKDFHGFMEKSFQEKSEHVDHRFPFRPTLAFMVWKNILMSIPLIFLRFFWLIVCAILYLKWSFQLIKSQQNHFVAVSGFFLNGIALWLVGIYLVFSLASDLRYLYLASCLITISHALFIPQWKAWGQWVWARLGKNS